MGGRREGRRRGKRAHSDLSYFDTGCYGVGVGSCGVRVFSWIDERRLNGRCDAFATISACHPPLRYQYHVSSSPQRLQTVRQLHTALIDYPPIHLSTNPSRRLIPIPTTALVKHVIPIRSDNRPHLIIPIHPDPIPHHQVACIQRPTLHPHRHRTSLRCSPPHHSVRIGVRCDET